MRTNLMKCHWSTVMNAPPNNVPLLYPLRSIYAIDVQYRLFKANDQHVYVLNRLPNHTSNVQNLMKLNFHHHKLISYSVLVPQKLRCGEQDWMNRFRAYEGDGVGATPCLLAVCYSRNALISHTLHWLNSHNCYGDENWIADAENPLALLPRD